MECDRNEKKRKHDTAINFRSEFRSRKDICEPFPCDQGFLSHGDETRQAKKETAMNIIEEYMRKFNEAIVFLNS